MLCITIMDAEHFRNITFQQMDALVTLAHEGSFSRAAQKMHLTQPALTKNIKNIENSLDLKIVNRSSAGITLTVEGRVIYDYARRIVKLRNEAGEKIVSLLDDTGGDIYIAASTIPATYLLPPLFAAFRKENRNIRLHVRSADSEEVINMILGGEAEIGFVGKIPRNKRIVFEPLWQDRLALIVPRGHRWCKRREVTLSEVLSEPFIVREKGSATREAVESYLKECKAISLADFNICCELGSSEAVKEAILAGLGISIISIHAVSRELKQKILREIQFVGCRIERSLNMIYQKQLDLKKSHKLLMEFIRNCRLEEDRKKIKA